MLFNSFEFAVFLLVVLPVYYVLSLRYQNIFLLVASYVFYGWWDWRFTGLLALSTVVDYFVAGALSRANGSSSRRALLLTSICVNLGILGFFKYFNFFVDSAADLVSAFGVSANVATLQVVLPVGISFYTFQTMAYTIDVYRRRCEPTRDFIAFALYVGYFPQLVAGPIERSQRLLPQILNPRHVDDEKLAGGARLILFGLLKKIAIADAVAPYVEQAFADPAAHSSLQLLLGVYLFAIQIYCDFSGYTDIARGVSRLLGIELMVNFRQPYISANITEFWRRWHISLSTWLRDYLYISLGGNRRGRFNTYRNLMLTMLLGGLWHGAAWTFVIWGGLHGLYLSVHKALLRGRRVEANPPPVSARGWVRRLIGIAITFHLVCLAWVFFRAASLAAAWEYLAGIAAGSTHVTLNDLVLFAFYGVLVALLDVLCWTRDSETPVVGVMPWAVRGSGYAVATLLLLYVGSTDVVPFLYFQF